MRAVPLIGIMLALTACGGADVKQEAGELQTFDVSESPGPVQNEPAPPAPVVAETAASAPAAAPQIAYTYTYGFRLPTDGIARVQESHLKLCDQLGQARCRVVQMTRSANQGEAAGAILKLQVSAPVARAARHSS